MGFFVIFLVFEKFEVKFIFLELRIKRVVFLNYFKSVLFLKNIEIIKKCLEDY